MLGIDARAEESRVGRTGPDCPQVGPGRGCSLAQERRARGSAPAEVTVVMISEPARSSSLEVCSTKAATRSAGRSSMPLRCSPSAGSRPVVPANRHVQRLLADLQPASRIGNVDRARCHAGFLGDSADRRSPVAVQRGSLGAGGLLWFPRQVPHAVANLTDRPCRFLTVVTPSGIEDFFRAQRDYLVSLPPGTPPDPARLASVPGAAERARPRPTTDSPVLAGGTSTQSGLSGGPTTRTPYRSPISRTRCRVWRPLQAGEVLLLLGEHALESRWGGDPERPRRLVVKVREGMGNLPGQPDQLPGRGLKPSTADEEGHHTADDIGGLVLAGVNMETGTGRSGRGAGPPQRSPSPRCAHRRPGPARARGHLCPAVRQKAPTTSCHPRST